MITVAHSPLRQIQPPGEILRRNLMWPFSIRQVPTDSEEIMRQAFRALAELAATRVQALLDDEIELNTMPARGSAGTLTISYSDAGRGSFTPYLFDDE